MQKAISEKQAVLTLAYNFKDIVQKNNWVTRYDKDADAFSFTVDKLPNDARLKYFGDEFAFYITKNGQVKGVFIEYFKKNFVQHNKDNNQIKGLLKRMDIEGNKFTTKIIEGFEDVLEESLAKGINLEPAC